MLFEKNWENQNYISLKLISKDNKIFDFVYFGDAEEFDEKFKETYGDEELRKLYSGKYFMNSKFLIDVLYEVKIDTYNFNETIKYFCSNIDFKGEFGLCRFMILRVMTL